MVGFQLKIMWIWKKSGKSEDLLNLQWVVPCAIFCGQIQLPWMVEIPVKEEPQWDSGLTSVRSSSKRMDYVKFMLILEMLIRSHESKD